MFALVLATAAAGFLTSVFLLGLHMKMMILRYVISVGVAYGTFLALVWVWIVCQQKRWDRIARVGGRPRIGIPEIAERGDAESKTVEEYVTPEWLELLDADELLPVALVAAGAASLFFVIWHVISAIAFAPEFFAEVFLDGVFGVALYCRLSRIEHRHWLKSAFVRTRALFLWTLLFFTFIGVISRYYAPEAVSIGGVIRHLTAMR